MSVMFNGRSLPDGTVLTMGVSFAGLEKVYTFALIKAGGMWYVTGSGPQAAGWGAIESWLNRDGRKLEWVREATGWAKLWPIVAQVGEPLSDDQIVRELVGPADRA